MALNDELAKVASERYALIKIVPALRLNMFLTLKAGTTYQATLTNKFEVDSVKVDGISYTISSTVNPTANAYYYDSATGVFEINFGAAIGTKQAILFFILRFTDSEFGVFDENGVKNGTASYQWHSRLNAPPAFEVSVKDMIAGVPSISSSRFTIFNDDLWLNSYLGNEYSYFNKDVTVWLCVNELVAAKFAGNLKNVNPSGDDYSFDIYDNLYKLNEPCLMGDTNGESYYDTATFSGMDGSKAGKIIPYVIGRSRYRFRKNTTIGVYAFELDPNETEEAVCLSVSNSLTWGLCRSGPNGFKTLNYGDINSSTITVGAMTLDYGNGVNNAREFSMSWNASEPNIELGDTIEIISGGTTYQGYVYARYNTYDFYGIMEPTAPGGVYTSVTASPNDGVGIIIVQGQYTFYPMVVNDYSVTTTTLASGNKFYKVIFSAGFETRHPGMSTIDYQNTRVYYRFTEKTSVTNDTTQAKVISRTLTAAGLSVDSSSITTADASLVATVNMTIPEMGSSSVRSYNYYLGLMLQSAFGYVYRDNSTLTTKYKLYTSPTTGNLILSNEILDLHVQFDGSEMAQSIRAFNDQIFFIDTDLVGPASLTYQSSSSRSKYQHGLTNQISIESVYRSVSSTVSRRTAFSENIQMIIRFSTASKFTNLNIGDDVSLADDRIPGSKTIYLGYSCTLLKILGIEYSSDKITFTCIDFKVA